MKRFWAVFLSVASISMVALAPVCKAQSASGAGTSSSSATSLSPAILNPPSDLTYRRPTEKTKLRNYLFDSFGPYPILGAAISAGINQADNTPPEWRQGAGAFGERVGSNFGIALATTTTRYALAEAFHEDTLYYRCECKGLLHRFNHAMISTVTARHGADGHRRFSFAALVAPYAGTMTAVYAWYPGRYNAEDGLRMGNYALLAFAGVNIAHEFIYGGPHTLFGHANHTTDPEPDSASNSKP
jgi:hypothetical protein